jgi:hypothetical protein
MRTPRIDRPMSVSELATLWKKPERTVRRWLTKAHRRSGFKLLSRENECGKWMVTIGALRRWVPELVDAGPADHEDLEQLRKRVRFLELKINALAAGHRKLAERLLGSVETAATVGPSRPRSA